VGEGFLPVDPSPATGAMQYTLGRVPGLNLSTIDARFDERYLTYDEVIAVPTNQPPVAQIRKPLGTLLVGEKSLFLAVVSSDPDGWIVLYRWRVGTQNPVVMEKSSFYLEFQDSGSYSIELTVVDNRGASAATTIEVVVVDPSEEREPDAGCGCGK
jgi:microbial collagenase